mgnify:CR=1 FL=1
MLATSAAIPAGGVWMWSPDQLTPAKSGGTLAASSTLTVANGTGVDLDVSGALLALDAQRGYGQVLGDEPITIIGSGTRTGTRVKKIISTISWPYMLPKRRRVSDSGRARWPISSRRHWCGWMNTKCCPAVLIG